MWSKLWDKEKNIILARSNSGFFPDSISLHFFALFCVLGKLTQMIESCRLPGPLASVGVRLMEGTNRIMKNKKRNRLEQSLSNFNMHTNYLGSF